MGSRSRRFWQFAAVAGAALITMAATAGPAAALTYVPISGSGSWSASVAIDQWSRDLAPSGITVNYTPDGTAAGRTDYIDGQDVFAASEPPFRNGTDKLANVGPELPIPWGYSYVPDVAGGIAFVYHLTVASHRITNLRLSGATLMKIFTGQITNWDNPQIARDFGRRLPSLPIKPVVHSEGSGDTFFFTRWMAHAFPRAWDAFCTRVTHGRVQPPCGQTEYYPADWGHAVAANGAANVMAYVTSPHANGAIGYDPYAYALAAHAPVLRLRNPAGRYVLPAAANVTEALTRAIINEDPGSPNFLQQDLDLVYTFRNPRSYPLSDYSYLIVPRAGTLVPTIFTRAKGRTLSAFLDFALCRGQRQLVALGYAPLPRNLVSGGLREVALIPGHVRVPTLAQCTKRR
jgi:ABC-type phosphate transport system substrate-binding protein